MPLGKQHTLISRTVKGFNIFNSYKGIYNNSITYNIGNIISYNGIFYKRINSSGFGNLPTDVSYWVIYN